MDAVVACTGGGGVGLPPSIEFRGRADGSSLGAGRGDEAGDGEGEVGILLRERWMKDGSARRELEL